MAFLAKRDAIAWIVSIFKIPIVTVQMVYREIATTVVANATSVVISFHDGFYKLPIFRKVISITLPYLRWNA